MKLKILSLKSFNFLKCKEFILVFEEGAQCQFGYLYNSQNSIRVQLKTRLDHVHNYINRHQLTTEDVVIMPASIHRQLVMVVPQRRSWLNSFYILGSNDFENPSCKIYHQFFKDFTSFTSFLVANRLV